MSRPVRALVVDDEPLVRDGLRRILESSGGIDVVAEAGDGIEAEAEAARTDPDVVLMDLRMPRRDGLEATRRLCARDPHPAVLILTTFRVDVDVLAALEAGASGYLLKDASPEEFVGSVHRVAAGDPHLSPDHARLVLDTLRTRAARHPRGGGSDGPPHGGHPGAPTVDTHGPGGGARVPAGADAQSQTRCGALDLLAALTAREREVCAALARGLSNAQIAAALGCSESMVKSHLVHVFGKLGLDNRVQVAILAHDAGLDTPAHLWTDTPPVDQ